MTIKQLTKARDDAKAEYGLAMQDIETILKERPLLDRYDEQSKLEFKDRINRIRDIAEKKLAQAELALLRAQHEALVDAISAINWEPQYWSGEYKDLVEAVQSALAGEPEGVRVERELTAKFFNGGIKLKGSAEIDIELRHNSAFYLGGQSADGKIYVVTVRPK